MGVPTHTGIRYKACTASGLRAYLGLQDTQHGAVIVNVAPTSPAAGVLQPGDVITNLIGAPVGDDGTIAVAG